MWDELGIAPCADRKAIRRAYAARLKKLDPDRDPQAFARLRSALEWALRGADGHDGRSDAPPPPASAQSDADAADDDLRTAIHSEPEHGEPAAEPVSGPTAENARKPEPQSPLPEPEPEPDHDDIRDQALLIAFEAALRRRDGEEATVLYYRAAATGALSLESAPDALERLLAVAVDDMTLDGAAFRHLVRAAGLDAPRSRTQVVSELHQRALARLRAEDWYDDLLAKAEQKKGRKGRREAKIARLILGRIGRHKQPRVDKLVLRTWLDQCKTHAAWLEDRIDPSWLNKLDKRLRRRELIGLVFFTVFIAAMLARFVYLSVVETIDGTVPLWPLLVGPFLAVFFIWILKLLVTEMLKRAIPGWSGFAGSGRAIWSRLKAKGREDAG